MKKPAQGKVFKGWVTTDGKNTWHPHFAKSRDPDPKFETYERVQYETTKKEIKIVLVLVIVIIQQLQHQPTTFFQFHEQDQQAQDPTLVVAGMIGQEARPQEY